MRRNRRCLFGVMFLVGAAPARAQVVPANAPENIGAVEGSASGISTGTGSAPVAPTTAAQFAPSQAPLTSIQPTSVVGNEALKKIAAPTDDYNEVVLLTPGATDVSVAGPGLQQDFGQSIRGLQYTEFSVLYDGIPVPGFPFNLAPQPGAYFLSRDFSSVTVNRGPGQASAIGPATFGGSVDLATQDPLTTPETQIYGTFGSFGTKFYGIQGNTGDLPQIGGASGVLDLTREEARGADTGISTERRNLFAKYEQPIGPDTVVTFAANADNAFTKTPYGATLANIAANGMNYSLNNDPRSQSFSDYTRDVYTTDFEYLGVHSFLGNGWTLDNKAYTTGYFQRDQHGLDFGGTAPNLSGTIYINNVPTTVDNDVPAQFNKFDYRDWGDVLRITRALPFGQLRFGTWFDREGFRSYQYDFDATRGSVPYTLTPAASALTQDYVSSLITVQPYGEFAYRPTSHITLTAGVKYSSVTRTLQGPITLGGFPANDHATYNKALPSFDANWRPLKGLAVYAQAAKGFLTPPLTLFNTKLPIELSPESTWSYQVGTAYHRRWLSVGADAYYIDFNNFINSTTVAGQTSYFNQGGAVFKGLEFEGTVTLGGGFAVYANGTLDDSAYNSNGNNLAQTPRRTAAASFLYDKGSVFRHDDDLYGNINAKVVGPQYYNDTSALGQFDTNPIKTWTQVDLNAGYVFPAFHRKFRASVNVSNLLGHRSFVGTDGATLEGQTLYWVQAGRSIFFSFAAYL